MKMQENVLKRVYMMEDKNGIHYARKEGRLYRTLRILYTLVGVYTLGIHLLFLLGTWLRYGGTEEMQHFTVSILTGAVCTALLVAGYVLTFFRWDLAAGIISVVPAAFLIPLFARMMEDSLGFWGYKASFYWRHLIPLSLLILLMVSMTGIAVRGKIKTEKQYKRVLENLYELYHKKQGEEISEEEWQKFLNEYDPHNYKVLFENTKKESKQNGDGE